MKDSTWQKYRGVESVPPPPKRHYCWFDDLSGRFVLQGKELHCGDCFQIKIGPAWHDVRIEHGGSSPNPIGKWYLVGVPDGYYTAPDAFEARLYPGTV
ncbi:MAG: DUF5348 domain-containing protein [Patescibacteria group bacterium]|nr:DUF5348 domain-containing protein [Patescibacteria group bacterium]